MSLCGRGYGCGGAGSRPQVPPQHLSPCGAESQTWTQKFSHQASIKASNHRIQDSNSPQRRKFSTLAAKKTRNAKNEKLATQLAVVPYLHNLLSLPQVCLHGLNDHCT